MMIHFYQKRFIFLIISAAIFVIGIAAILINGVQLDIEFKGGCILKYEYSGFIDAEQAASVASEALGRIASCQTMNEAALQKDFLVINLTGNEGLSSTQQETLDAALKQNFSDAGLSLYETSIVEPFIGQKFLKQSIFAIILAFILVILYVWYSFRKIGGLSAGTMAVVALIHDICVVFFAFVVFKLPIDENFVAAALTIIGFSINDTIVIYDRIRENARLYPKMDIEERVDKSITQSMTRSINTNAAVFASIAMVFIFAQIYGISSIKSFALPMMFGIVSGCYSTICIAGPLWVKWKKHRKLAAKKPVVES